MKKILAFIIIIIYSIHGAPTSEIKNNIEIEKQNLYVSEYPHYHNVTTLALTEKLITTIGKILNNQKELKEFIKEELNNKKEFTKEELNNTKEFTKEELNDTEIKIFQKEENAIVDFYIQLENYCYIQKTIYYCNFSNITYDVSIIFFNNICF
uniref:Uncharacterized protein n=1 Tax=Faxonius propinquus nudivirus TaxID=3139431 RepID=A0AAU8GEA1_9VIRU